MTTDESFVYEKWEASSFGLGHSFVIRISSFVIPLAALSVLCLAGCVQEMADQPRHDPLESSEFFADGKASRPLVAGTVARGHLRTDEHFFEGIVGGKPAESFPERITSRWTAGELLDRGRERFGIFCSHCHGLVGGGRGGPEELEDMVGMVVKRGFPTPPTYHIDRLRKAPPGYIYAVISSGFGRMPAHADQIPPEDRWAIVAWVRALQYSQHRHVSELSEDERRRLEVMKDKG